jgi:hypothetical protein
MNNFQRILSLVILTAFINGCVVAPRPYSPPIDIPLQEPPPGMAIVYLLRAPYDKTGISVSIGQRKVAELPESSYTAISLPPGSHVLSTQSSALFGGSTEVAPPVELVVQKGERRFLNISGTTQVGTSLAGVVGVVPIFIRGQATVAGTHSWKEVTEIDAQGLMSIAKAVLPAQGAL